MMGSVPAATSRPTSSEDDMDGTIVLLRVMADPKKYEQKLGTLLKRQEEARAAEEAANKAIAELAAKEAKVRKASSVLDDREKEIEAERKSRATAMKTAEGEIAAQRAELDRDREMLEARTRKEQADLQRKMSELNARAGQLEAREAGLTRAASETARLAGETRAENVKAKGLRDDLERKTEKLAAVLRELAG